MDTNIATTNLDGIPQGHCTLRLHDGKLLLDDQLVLATRPLGSRIVLIVPGRQYCVAISDYNRIVRAATAR